MESIPKPQHPTQESEMEDIQSVVQRLIEVSLESNERIRNLPGISEIESRTAQLLEENGELQRRSARMICQAVQRHIDEASELMSEEERQLARLREDLSVWMRVRDDLRLSSASVVRSMRELESLSRAQLSSNARYLRVSLAAIAIAIVAATAGASIGLAYTTERHQARQLETLEVISRRSVDSTRGLEFMSRMSVLNANERDLISTRLNDPTTTRPLVETPAPARATPKKSRQRKRHHSKKR